VGPQQIRKTAPKKDGKTGSLQAVNEVLHRHTSFAAHGGLQEINDGWQLEFSDVAFFVF